MDRNNRQKRKNKGHRKKLEGRCMTYLLIIIPTCLTLSLSSFLPSSFTGLPRYVRLNFPHGNQTSPPFPSSPAGTSNWASQLRLASCFRPSEALKGEEVLSSLSIRVNFFFTPPTSNCVRAGPRDIESPA